MIKICNWNKIANFLWLNVTNFLVSNILTFKKVMEINIIILYFYKKDNIFNLYLHDWCWWYDSFRFTKDSNSQKTEKMFYVTDSLQFLRNFSYLIISPRECIVINSISIHSALIQFQQIRSRNTNKSCWYFYILLNKQELNFPTTLYNVSWQGNSQGSRRVNNNSDGISSTCFDFSLSLVQESS